MAVTRAKKEQDLKELVEKFAKSKSVVFTDYRGLDVGSLSTLRGNLRKVDAEMKVGKKTLMQLAAKENKIDGLDPSLMEGPVAATFSYEDPLVGIKVLFKFSKENDKLKLLGGIIDGKAVGSDVIAQYAQLPGREELLAKLLGSMNSPISGTVSLLNNLIAGFVRVLNAHKDKMPAGESKVEAQTSAVSDEAIKTDVAPAQETSVQEASVEEGSGNAEVA